MIEEELNFTQEANSMEQIRLNLALEKGITIPLVHRAYSTQKVMCTTWHDGVKISNIEQIDAWKINRREIATCLLRAYSKMLFKDGFYHADPHPGNILVQKDGLLVLLDFGAVSTLSLLIREGIPQLIEAAIKNDMQGMIVALNKMGFLAQGRDAEKIAEKMLNALRNFLQNEVEFEGLNFKDIKVDPFNNSLFRLIQEIGFNGIAGTVQVPKDYVLLSRMMTLLLGLCNTLDPTLNPLDVIRPYAKEYMLKNEGIFTFVKSFLRNTLTTTLSLPEEIHQTLQQIKRGEVEVKNPDVKAAVQLIYILGQQIIYTLLFITTAIFAYLFHKNGEVLYCKTAIYASAFILFLLFRAFRKGKKLK
jgi:predicted unusual protein kinase regulating ubiquinone biosynthesis (AarF/ABC1/UbiB family)